MREKLWKSYRKM